MKLVSTLALTVMSCAVAPANIDQQEAVDNNAQAIVMKFPAKTYMITQNFVGVQKNIVVGRIMKCDPGDTVLNGYCSFETSDGSAISYLANGWVENGWVCAARWKDGTGSVKAVVMCSRHNI